MAANSEGEIGSQFFITLDSLPQLDGSDHVIIGKVILGREILQ